jgi:hypothetical protein
MARNVRLDHSGIRSLMNSPQVEALTVEAANAVADNVRAMGIRVGDKDGGPREEDMPVEVSLFHTDRPHAVVAITHASGDAVQAKHGALSKAAAQAGLDFQTR